MRITVIGASPSCSSVSCSRMCRPTSVMEQMIAAAYPRSEMVRPGLLTNGAAKENYQVQDTLFKGIKVGSISRQDVAHFMVTEAEQPQYLGKSPALSY